MHKKILSLIITILIVLINILIIFYPQAVISAAKEAVLLWAENVLPSLLPFFIITNILMGFGFINFLGILLEPVMRPLFNVPGCGGFALAVGLTSGYPLGAKICADLRGKNNLTKAEATRLSGFSNNAGPLFVIGVLGTGMFASVTAGYFLLICNIISAVICGFLLKYYHFDKNISTYKIRKNILKQALKEMEKAGEKDGRAFGRLLGDSIAKSIESILHIAGFIVLFGVIIKIAESVGLIEVLSEFLSEALNMEKNSAEGLIYGFLEITNGAYKISQTGLNRLNLTICAGIMSFGGLSIFAQSVAMLSKTDINTVFYFFSKILNGALSAVICWFFYPFINFTVTEETYPAFAVSPVSKFTASAIIYGAVLISILIMTAVINIACFIQDTRKKKRYL